MRRGVEKQRKVSYRRRPGSAHDVAEAIRPEKHAYKSSRYILRRAHDGDCGIRSARGDKFTNSLHKVSTRCFRTWLNMSQTMIMSPLDHWPMPPRSGWLNYAWDPLPAMRVRSNGATASNVTACRSASSCSRRLPSGENLPCGGHRG